MKILPLVILLLVCVFIPLTGAIPAPTTSPAHTDPARPVPVEEWSKPVNGLRGRIVLSLRAAEAKRISVYIELENVSPTGKSMVIGNHPKLSWKLTETHATTQPTLGAFGGGDGGVLLEQWATIPWQCRFSLPVNAHGDVGTRSAAIISVNQERWDVFPSDNWTKNLEPGEYRLSAIFTNSDNTQAPEGVWNGILELPGLAFSVSAPTR